MATTQNEEYFRPEREDQGDNVAGPSTSKNKENTVPSSENWAVFFQNMIAGFQNSKSSSTSAVESRRLKASEIYLPSFDPDECQFTAVQWCDEIENHKQRNSWTDYETRNAAFIRLQVRAKKWAARSYPLCKTWEELKERLTQQFISTRRFYDLFRDMVEYTSDQAATYIEYSTNKMALIDRLDTGWGESNKIEVVISGITDVQVMPCPAYNVELELGEPSRELLEQARINCGEDPSMRLQAIDELRDMIYERGECTPHRMDDDYLVRFLRARQFIPQRAHRLMVNYYKFKDDYPELFDVYPLDLRRIGDAHVVAVPPYRDQDGRRLLFYRMGPWDPKEIPVDDILKGTIFALELGALEPRNQILGGVALFDLEDLTMQHVWQITPSVASKIVKLLVSSFPATTHAIHIVNNSWIFDKMYSIFRPFLTKSMQSRIFFHGYDMASLHKHIHPEHLPERYGGTWQDYAYTIWLEALKDNLTIAKEMMACGYKFREHEVGLNVAKHIREVGGK